MADIKDINARLAEAMVCPLMSGPVGYPEWRQLGLNGPSSVEYVLCCPSRCMFWEGSQRDGKCGVAGNRPDYQGE